MKTRFTLKNSEIIKNSCYKRLKPAMRFTVVATTSILRNHFPVITPPFSFFETTHLLNDLFVIGLQLRIVCSLRIRGVFILTICVMFYLTIYFLSICFFVLHKVGQSKYHYSNTSNTTSTLLKTNVINVTRLFATPLKCHLDLANDCYQKNVMKLITLMK